MCALDHRSAEVCLHFPSICEDLDLALRPVSSNRLCPEACWTVAAHYSIFVFDAIFFFNFFLEIGSHYIALVVLDLTM